MSKLNPTFNIVAEALEAKQEAIEREETMSGKARRPAPFSLRLSDAERIRLTAEAAGAPLGAFIKAKLLGGEFVERKRRKGLSIKDREALAQALALLGRSRLSTDLNQIAQALSVGIWPITPETEAELYAAIQDVRLMRRLLFTALGYRSSEDQP